MAFIVNIKGQKQIIMSFSFFFYYLVYLVGIVNGQFINLSFFPKFSNMKNVISIHETLRKTLVQYQS